MASAARSLAEGARLGRWKLGSRIAIGGMAEIFKATDEAGQVVAIKVLLPQYAEDADFLRMFEHEAKLHQLLSHPNLVQVHEAGADGELRYLVMDYVDGMPLSDLGRWLSKRERRMPAGVACYIVDALLEALEHVHDAKDTDGSALGIVHRDVTPQNLLLSRTGEVRLGDFGIARSNIRDGRTRTGVIKGKLRFLAPEQVTGSSVDARTDLYAVGVMLFELLTGEPFIGGNNEIELLREAEAPTWRAPSTIASADVDPRVDGLLEKALRRFPEERYPSARAFRRALERLVGELGWQAEAKDVANLVSEALEPGSGTAKGPRSRVAGGDAPTLAITPEGFDKNREPVAEAEPNRPIPVSKRRSSVRTATLGVAVVALVAVGVAVSKRERAGERHADGSAAPAVTAASDSATPEPVAPLAPPEASSLEIGPDRAENPKLASKGRTPVATVAEPSSSSAGPAPDPNAARLASLKQQLDGLRGSLAKRGILLSDLDSTDRALLRTADEQVSNGRVSEAEATLSTLAPKLGAIQVDGEFVKKKLDRTNAAIRNAEQRGQDTTKVRELSASALQDYMAGRHSATNQKLNQILALLAR